MDYWIIGGASMYMWQSRRVRGHAPLGIFLILNLLSDAIWWNLGLFSHKHNFTIYCVIKPFIIDSHVK